MRLKPGMWVLMLNDMRSPKVEYRDPVACSRDPEELVDYVHSQLAESPWRDGKWGKVFRQHSPLEWFNCDGRNVMEMTTMRELQQYRPPPHPDVPSVPELMKMEEKVPVQSMEVVMRKVEEEYREDG